MKGFSSSESIDPQIRLETKLIIPILYRNKSNYTHWRVVLCIRMIFQKKTKLELGNSKRFSDIFQKINALVCLGCHSTIPEMRDLTNRALYSHSSGGWKSRREEPRAQRTGPRAVANENSAVGQPGQGTSELCSAGFQNFWGPLGPAFLPVSSFLSKCMCGGYLILTPFLYVGWFWER